MAAPTTEMEGLQVADRPVKAPKEKKEKKPKAEKPAQQQGEGLGHYHTTARRGSGRHGSVAACARTHARTHAVPRR